MTNIYDKWDQEIDTEGLEEAVEELDKNGGQGGYDEVPHGIYEVKIDKMELKASKNGDPMLSVWFKVLSGDYKNSLIFMNQVITRAFQIHIANEFLRSLDTSIDVHFDGKYSHYNETILDIFEEVNGKLEYELDYGENNKGFNTFKITDVFEVE